MKSIISSLFFVLPLCATENLITGFPETFRPAKEWHLTGNASVVDGSKELTLTLPAQGEGSILSNGKAKTKQAPYLYTKKDFGDIELHIEFMLPHGSNSGLYFMGRYEVQILDSFGKEKLGFGDLGGIYQRWQNQTEIKGYGFEGKAPALNASHKPGEWQTINVRFRAPRFDLEGKKIENARFLSVHVNGKQVQDNVEVTGPTRAHPMRGEVARAPVAIQGDHGPIAIRSLVIKPIESD